MKPIIKIKNPVLRWLAGLVIIAAMVVVTAMICYAVGEGIVKKIPFSFFPFNMCRDIANTGWLGAIFSGPFLSCYLFVVIMIIYGLIEGIKGLGEKFFDP